ncbi:hypothetical protein DYB25_001796 [Aphanomyces astaci]|uniref:Uncharacterized protein n=2 Tax=Aphanomyces astaci TaxID=112090 RepID=A0A397AG42_APHAT|nr:hypothetical protein DYB25_001796 [Aphanomyces astaci]
MDKKKRRKGTKDLKLLSFGDEADEEFVQQPVKKIKGGLSSHDVLRDPKLSQRVDESLQSKVASMPVHVDPISDGDDVGDDIGDDDVAAASLSTLKARISDKLKKKSALVHTTAKPKLHDAHADHDKEASDAYDDGKKKKKSKKESKKVIKDEYTLLKEHLKKTHKAAAMLKGDKLKAAEAEKAYQEMLTPLQLRRQKYLASKKSSAGDRQKQTLSRLESFKSTLSQVLETKKKKHEKTWTEKDTEVYHGQVMADGSDDDDDNEIHKDPSWMTKELKFKKHIDLVMA